MQQLHCIRLRRAGIARLIVSDDAPVIQEGMAACASLEPGLSAATIALASRIPMAEFGSVIAIGSRTQCALR
jgi:hypothetical protein